jgi:hypothetical protein
MICLTLADDSLMLPTLKPSFSGCEARPFPLSDAVMQLTCQQCHAVSVGPAHLVVDWVQFSLPPEEKAVLLCPRCYRTRFQGDHYGETQNAGVPVCIGDRN